MAKRKIALYIILNPNVISFCYAFLNKFQSGTHFTYAKNSKMYHDANLWILWNEEREKKQQQQQKWRNNNRRASSLNWTHIRPAPPLFLLHSRSQNTTWQNARHHYYSLIGFSKFSFSPCWFVSVGCCFLLLSYFFICEFNLCLLLRLGFPLLLDRGQGPSNGITSEILIP